MKNLFSILTLALFSVLLMSLSLYQAPGWIAPKESKTLVNPLAEDAKSISTGSKIYQQLCWTCHGKTGLGDGPAARSLRVKPLNFQSELFQDQTDGEIFWKISEGKGEMASYKNSYNETMRWSLVNYLRTLNPEK